MIRKWLERNGWICFDEGDELMYSKGVGFICQDTATTLFQELLHQNERIVSLENHLQELKENNLGLAKALHTARQSISEISVNNHQLYKELDSVRRAFTESIEARTN